MSLSNLPSDPHILASFVNTKLRDEYPRGLDSMCDDMDIDRKELEDVLEKAGYSYIPESNRFG